MLTDADKSVLGVPHDTVTTWAIVRKDKNGRFVKQAHPDEKNIFHKEWPLDTLSVDEVKRRWGPGEYRCIWFADDPKNPVAEHRRVTGGTGKYFEIGPDPEPEVAPPPPPAPPAPPLAGLDPVARPLDFALQLISMSDARTNQQIQAIAAMASMAGGRGPGGDNAGNAAVMAELAAMKATLEADRRQREIDDKHRAELAEKDKKIAELEREAEDAGSDDGPTFEPGAPLLEQLAYSMLNAAAKNPTLAATVLTPILTKLIPGGAPATQPPPPPQALPRPQVAMAPRPATLPAPPPTSPPVDEVPPQNRVGFVPIVGANGQVRRPAKSPEPQPAPEAKP